MVYESVLLGVELALLVAILYSLRRIYILEYKMMDLDVKIEKILSHHKKKK